MDFYSAVNETCFHAEIHAFLILLVDIYKFCACGVVINVAVKHGFEYVRVLF